MIKKLNGEREAFLLLTRHTAYALAIAPSGHAEHLYYGAKIDVDTTDELDAIREKREFEPGNAIVYSKDVYNKYPKIALEDMCLEMSGTGHGDIREPFLELVRADGSRTTDFLYQSYTINDDPPALTEMPSSYSREQKSEHLCLKLADGDLILELHYYVYPECDVITRRAVLVNNGEEPVELERLLSTQVDFPDSGWSITSFHGAWAREMEPSTLTLRHGKFVVESRAGCSSSRANPFFMVHREDATEHYGDVYGFNLIYSGNHYAAAEVNAYGKTRVVQGINPAGFRWLLNAGDSFETPEAVMTYSGEGFSRQSRNMHRFVKEHIVRGEWADKERPVLLNSWEAAYFNISENNLVTMAKAGRDLGIELFVMDDGWFGERNDDSRALGDWDPNPKKLPGGLGRLSKKITDLGIRFGLWVEPEMVNVNSRLYETHPDWAMAIPNRLHSEGRNQRILDLSNPEVVDYLTEKMTEVFSSGDISYVKWDMNRIFSDVFSLYLPPERQGEVTHRYICGLYRMLTRLTERFPHILFEGCAAGGNRFDLGILCYFPQIWGSDNTDAICRSHIQEGYSYGYPLSCVGAHVAASPNHQTLRKTPLATRFDVAAFGALGYELDVRDLSQKQKEEMKAQITLYKAWRGVFQKGQFYRLSSGRIHSWICVSEDRRKAVGMMLQELSEPNTGAHRFVARGLDPALRYRFCNLPAQVDVKLFGSLINTMAPFHVKQDSAVHDLIAKFVKMNGESDVYTLSGSALMNAGVSLSQSFSGTGYNDKVRLFPDFASRLYLIEALDEPEI